MNGIQKIVGAMVHMRAESKQNIYYGYWSFEAGAIAKILNIDDDSIKNISYYPYDLVHYRK